VWLWRRKPGGPCLAGCHRDPAPDKRMRMEGWMDGHLWFGPGPDFEDCWSVPTHCFLSVRYDFIHFSTSGENVIKKVLLSTLIALITYIWMMSHISLYFVVAFAFLSSYHLFLSVVNKVIWSSAMKEQVSSIFVCTRCSFQLISLTAFSRLVN